MKKLNIFVKDVTNFMKSEKVLFASSSRGRKRFSILLRAGPNIKRYVVRIDGEEHSFTDKGRAVRFFNET